MPRKTRGKTTAKIVHAAREQRRTPTPTEKKLWEALRGRRLAGLKFRRQHPFEQFVLDAFCVEYQLEIEVDGEIHADPIQAAHDAARTEFLEAHGIRVLRFSTEDVEKNFGEVLRRIVEAAGASPPASSPEVERHTSGEGPGVRPCANPPGS